jgi:type II secretory pathway component PulF
MPRDDVISASPKSKNLYHAQGMITPSQADFRKLGAEVFINKKTCALIVGYQSIATVFVRRGLLRRRWSAIVLGLPLFGRAIAYVQACSICFEVSVG